MFLINHCNHKKKEKCMSLRIKKNDIKQIEITTFDHKVA